jgi:hypothetical protein
MAGGLRNEDYVAFLDESGENGLQVVSGVLIPARWLRSAERRWRDFVRDHLGSRSGRAEVKGYDLVKGKGVALHAQSTLLSNGWAPLSARAAGRQFYAEALEHIATVNEVRTLTVGLPTKYPLEVYRLWYWMAYCLLVELPKAPRPRIPLIAIDGQDATFRGAQDLIAYRFYRAFPRAQPYVSAGSRWFVGGAVHQDSKLHPFIQMADLTAGAARHSIAQRKPYRHWYDKHLVGHAKSIGRDIDVSRHALAQLKKRSRKDSCKSGWPNALLPA